MTDRYRAARTPGKLPAQDTGQGILLPACPIGWHSRPRPLRRNIQHPTISLMRGRTGMGVLAVLALAITACGGGPGSTRETSTTSTTSSSSPPTSAPSSVQVTVGPCPVPASDYAGTQYSPHAPPPTLTLTSALVPPKGATLFGSVFPLDTSASYMIGPSTASCQGSFASGDGGMVMTAAERSNASQGVTMVLRPGGAGPSTDLACPYIPAVEAADQSFQGGNAQCGHPSGDVVQQIATGTTNVYAAAVWVPADVMDSNFTWACTGGCDPFSDMTGRGSPTLALFTAQVLPPMSASGMMIACTLPSTERNICSASLRFFLANESGISKEVSSDNLSQMVNAVAAFVSGR